MNKAPPFPSPNLYQTFVSAPNLILDIVYQKKKFKRFYHKDFFLKFNYNRNLPCMSVKERNVNKIEKNMFILFSQNINELIAVINETNSMVE